MKIAFLFAGQGVQKVGMADDFLKEKAFNDIFSKIDVNIQNLVKNGPDELLNETENAQSGILGVSLGIANILKSRGIDCEYSAGLSLGEYSALTYAGVFTVDEAIEIVKERSRIMSKALEGKDTGMTAVLNSNVEKIQEVMGNLPNLEIANYNSPKQIVITGSNTSIKSASEIFKENKIRTIPLNVSGAFHSSYLKNASDEFYEFLNRYKLKVMKNRVVFNSIGMEIEDEDIRDLLKRQMHSSVRFMQSIYYMIDKGIDVFIEIGPGKVLSSFVSQINSELSVYNVSSMEDIERVVNILNE